MCWFFQKIFILVWDHRVTPNPGCSIHQRRRATGPQYMSFLLHLPTFTHYGSLMEEWCNLAPTIRQLSMLSFNRKPRDGHDFHTPSVFASSIMVSAWWNAKSPQIAQGDVSPGGSGKYYDPERDGSGSVTAQGPKSGASRKVTSRQKGKQSEKRRDVGMLSKLPDMPLDILYEVSSRIISTTDGRVYDDAFGRYSLLYTRWIYCECRGPIGPFVTSSRTNPRGRSGKLLLTISLKLKGRPRALRT